MSPLPKGGSATIFGFSLLKGIQIFVEFTEKILEGCHRLLFNPLALA
jgi:hypothetical protein